MPFPDAARTIYPRNPLKEVICQLRFPAILRIDAERAGAAEFQELIRNEYPLYEEKQTLAGQMPPELRSMLDVQGGQLERHFSSGDQQWVVSLTRDFIALSSKSYERWESFRQHLAAPRSALEQVYVPSFYSRIGLRYRNVIRRTDYGLQDVEWSELLQPHIAAELAASPDVVVSISHATHLVSFQLDQFGGKAKVRHGLVDLENERCYSIDADFFTEERTDHNDAGTALDYFNEQARRLFQWCISQRLREAFAAPVAA